MTLFTVAIALICLAFALQVAMAVWYLADRQRLIDRLDRAQRTGRRLADLIDG